MIAFKPHAVTVDIVLATFNGARFLAQQLDSLLTQRHRALRILISDDGSGDDSVAVISSYAARDSRVQLVNVMRQGGVVANFRTALASTDADYLMFCDQDDVWLEDKVDTMLDALRERENVLGATTPLMGFSDLTVVGRNLEVENASFYAGNNLNPVLNTDPRYLLWSSTVYGCTTVFNRALAELGALIPTDVPMHDQWLALLAASVGELFYVPRQTILYRQHGGNVVGAKRKNVVERLGSVRKNLGVIACDVRKCRTQFGAAVSVLSARKMMSPTLFSYQLHRFSGRWAFVWRNIRPFMRERTMYAVLFSVFFLIDRHEH